MIAEKNFTSFQALDKFCVAGINYNTADTTVRGIFSVSPDAQRSILADAKLMLQLRSVLVISTCNRTEIYGFADNVHSLVDLLLPHTKGTKEIFTQHAYLKSGKDALLHLFNVAAGLDSQILGDYEILGQLKQGMDLSMQAGMIGPLMNRTLNFAIQSSKKIKTVTGISTGTVSVSYAAIELLKKTPAVETKKILVIGAGKFGTNVCKNLRQYFPANTVLITNRTNETARLLAEQSGLQFVPYEQMQHGIEAADIVIVCSNATQYTIETNSVKNKGTKLIFDLSVPVSVHPDVKLIPEVEVIDVDEISKGILDKTLSLRKMEIPKAEAIIIDHVRELVSWLEDYRYSLHIKSWKGKLHELQDWAVAPCCGEEISPLPNQHQKVQKAVSRLAVNLRSSNQKGCLFINAVNDYLQM